MFNPFWVNALLKFYTFCILTANLVSWVVRIEKAWNFTYCLKLRLDLKIQDKSLKVMKPVFSLVNRQGKFHFTKNELFHNFCKDIAHIFESLSWFHTVYRGVSWIPVTFKKLEFFLTLVNGWKLLPIVTESLILDIVEVLDMPLVSEGYVCE